MQLIPVTPERFDAVYEKMCSAFVREERRDKEDERACFSDPQFRMCEIMEQDAAIGFAAFWLFADFLFLEHIAVDSDKRGGGNGTRAVQYLQRRFGKPVILEVEPPEDEMKRARIRFYEHIGFQMNPQQYRQPSYHGEEAVELQIMSSPTALSEAAFTRFVQETRRVVYRTDDR